MTSLFSQLQKINKEATPGDWLQDNGTVWGGLHYDHEGEHDADLCFDCSVADAALIVGCRNSLPAVLNLIEAAQRLRTARDGMLGRTFYKAADEVCEAAALFLQEEEI